MGFLYTNEMGLEICGGWEREREMVECFCLAGGCAFLSWESEERESQRERGMRYGGVLCFV